MGPTRGLQHENYEKYPENSLPAFLKCLEMDSDGIELDVRLTKDKKLIVFHDTTLSGHIISDNYDLRPIEEYTLDELKSYKIGAQCSIPSLVEFLDMVETVNPAFKNHTGRDIKVNIELKGDGIPKYLTELLKPYFESKRLSNENFLFNGSDWNEIDILKRLCPELSVCINVPGHLLNEPSSPHRLSAKLNACARDNSGYEKISAFIQTTNCYGIDLKIADITPSTINFCKENHLALVACECEGMSYLELNRQLEILISASKNLPGVIFKSNNVSFAKEILSRYNETSPARGAEIRSP